MPEPTARTAQTRPGPRLRAFGLGLAHAALFALCFQPLGWWWAAFLAPVPLFAVARRPGASPLSAGFWAMLGVLPFWVWTHGWIANVSAAGVYPLVVYLGLYAWAFIALGAVMVRARRVPPAIGLAVLWVGLEFFRARIAWSGYPWYLTAHPLIDAPGLAAPAALGGVSLVSLLTVLPGAWFVCWRSSGRGLPAAIAGVMLLWAAAGVLWSGRSRPDAVPVRVGVVQTNVPQDNRLSWTVEQRLMDWLEMRDLTVRVASEDPPPELIVWPEGLVPGWTMDPRSLEQEFRRGIIWRLDPATPEEFEAIGHYGRAVPATQVVEELLAMQAALGIPMLVGSVAYDGLDIVIDDSVRYESEAMYNSAFLLRNGRVSDVWYDKVHLTPFGETMPYISHWDWLEERLLAIGAQGMTFALSPGRSARTIPLDRPGLPGVELATPICFEATMPAVCRTLVNRAGRTGRAVLMVNITNDGWFGATDRGRLAHELSARWRCVELGVPMVRCANTGVSGLIDAKGRVVLRTAPRRAETVVVEARAAAPRTPFARSGEWAGWVCLGGAPVLVWLGRRRNSTEPAGRVE